MKKVLSLLLLAFTFLLLAGVSYADVVCQPIYGGGQTCVTVGNSEVNKQVLNTQTNQFVDNLGVNDPKFKASDLVTFKIFVRNTGGTSIGNVTVRDIFPQFVNFTSGPGNFDSRSKTLTFSIGTLNPSEAREFTLQGKVADSNLPAGTACVVNQVTVTGDSMQASDIAQLCIETKPAVTKGGLPVLPPPKVTVTPPTGPELIPLISLLPAGIGGWFLRRKSILKRGGEK